ncbi:hypothetical protein LTR65_005563 [Meristemomyces frigidus]
MTTIHQFALTDSALGIAEVEEDVFVVVTAGLNGTSASPGSAKIWKVDMLACEPGSPSTVTLIATLPAVGFPNGVTSLPSDKRNVLVADSAKGIIWRVDTHTGACTVAMENTSFAFASALLPLGVNGIHVLGSELYFTNTGAGLFGKVNITTNGLAAGAVQIITSSVFPDDFALTANGTAYIVGSSALWRASPDGQVAVLAGPNDLALEGDTSAHFGRTSKDKDVLYIVTNGGLAAPVDGVVHGGQVLAVNVDALS